VAILTFGVECKEVVNIPEDLPKALGFESLLKLKDCLDSEPLTRARGALRNPPDEAASQRLVLSGYVRYRAALMCPAGQR
jgi:hypothetical protein